MRISLGDNRNSIITLAVFAVLIFIIMYFTPYTRDDWAWGSSVGLDRMWDFFKDYNGRYAGNIVEIILTRVRWLRALVETGVVIGIVHLISPKGNRQIFYYFLAMCLLLLEPVAMMRQTLVYTAGFSNYVIPTLFMVWFIRYFKPLLLSEKKEDLNFKQIHSVPIALLAFFSCLFMEHVTLYLAFLSFIIIIYSIKKYKKVFSVSIGFFIGNLAGSLLMFLNGAYWKVIAGNDNYRSVGETGSGVETNSFYFKKIGYILFSENWFFNIVMAVIIFALIKKYRNEIKNKGFIIVGKISGILLIILTILVTIANIVEKNVALYGLNDVINSVFTTILYAVLISLILIISTVLIKSKTKKFLWVLLASMIILDLPLMIVNPISPRCFFPMYVLLCMFILGCFKFIDLPKWSFKLTAGILIVSFILYLIIYVPLYKADVDRVNMIKNEIASGKTIIIIEKLPNEYFLWGATPPSGTMWERRYKFFHEIPIKVKLLNAETQE